MLRLLLIVVALGGLGSGLCAAEIYKWVDSNGVTHYGGTPPPGTKSTTIQTAPAPDPAAASQAAARAKKLSADADRISAEIAGEQASRQAQQDNASRDYAARLQRCSGARQQLDVVLHQGPVFRFGGRGERIYLPDNARDGEIKRLRDEVANQCTGLESDAATRQRWREMTNFIACARARERLQSLDNRTSRQQVIDEARQKVDKDCSPQKFPPRTGSQDEWFHQFQL